MKTLKYILSAAIILSMFSSASYGDSLKIGVNSWCPHVCIPSEGQLELGYTTDIVIKILTDAGYQVEPVIAPWQRILHDAKEGRIDIVASGYKEEAPFLTYTKQSIGTTEEVFYVRENEMWRYMEAASLESIDKVGLINGATYGSNEFSNFIKNNPSKFITISGNDIPERQVKMLTSKRLNAFVGEKSVVKYFSSKINLQDKIKAADYLSKKSYLYVGFSPEHPQASLLASIIDKGVLKLRKSGEFEKIMKKYDL
jgi:polar amino acid transport system substrate-binding protein